MVTPRLEVPEPFRTDSRGRLTCTTCHNPHIDVRGDGKTKGRFVVEGEGRMICGRCHRR